MLKNSSLKTSKKRTPGLINLILSHRCPTKCLFCDIPSHRAKELPTADWLAVIEEVADWVTPEDLVVFAGGEPMMHKDFFELIEKAASVGLGINIVTNGYFLEGEALVKLAQLKLSLSVSIDGFQTAHDRLRNAPGLFYRIMNAFDYLAEASEIGLSVGTVINRMNLDDLVPLAKYFNEQPYIQAIYYQALVQNLAATANKNWYQDHPLWPRDFDHVKRILDALIELKNNQARIVQTEKHFRIWMEYFRDPLGFSNNFRCTVPERMLTVAPNGNVTLCDHMKPIGNIRDSSFSELWNSEKADECRAQALNCRILCNLCINCCNEELMQRQTGQNGE